MSKYVSIMAVLASGMFMAAACGAPAVTSAPTLAPAVQPTVAVTTTSASATTQATSSNVSTTATLMAADSSLGKILVSDNGMTLYMFTKDSGGTSACYDQCATSWPPLLTKDKPQAGTGVDASLLGTVSRKDGSQQVTYKAMPVYYFSKDKAAGDVSGQGVGSVWFVLAPNGDVVKAKTTTNVAATPATGAAAVIVSAAKTSLGQVLVDAKGMTLYVFLQDANGVSACYDQCAKNWPALITSVKASAMNGVNATLLGTTKRTDGSMQVTYKGMPLYYFASDKAGGDVKGQGIGSIWYVVAANGDVIKGTGQTGSIGYGN
jgi:predicted lipoprotein with Yx(FWY)xxD motif